jgi:hypothetical protein
VERMADAKINRQKFQSLIGAKQWTAKEFHERWTNVYGFSIGYKNFMELINNNVSWKLVYAFAIAEMLEVDVYNLFEFSKQED